MPTRRSAPRARAGPLHQDHRLRRSAGDGGGVLPTKLVELMAIAIDASCIHLYTPGIRRHIQRALALGATVEEIMEVLKLCGAQGVDACELKAPILSQELATRVPQEGGPEREA